MTTETRGRDDERSSRASADAWSESHPRVAGRRITDASATVGAICWLGLRFASSVDVLRVTIVEQFVALALLVLVPLGLGIAASQTDRDGAGPERSLGDLLPYRIAVVAQLPAALAATVALALPVASPAGVVLVLPWIGVTAAVASLGLWRLATRGLGPIEELAIDAALLYVPVGAVALLLHRAGISLRFPSIIVLLTAVHYHYAGFVLPLVTGRIGRILAADGIRDSDSPLESGALGRGTALAIGVIVVNVALIAVGITFSPTVEIVAVALFATAVVAFALVTLRRVVPAVDRRQGVPLAVAVCTLLWTMALAMAYAYSAFPATGVVVTIGEMITWHGAFNAFGFAVPALLALRLRDAAG